MLQVGGGELLVILLVALVFLGPTRLPVVARQIGQAVGTLKSMASGFQSELEAASKQVTDQIDAATKEAVAGDVVAGDVAAEDPETMHLYGPMAVQQARERTQALKKAEEAAAAGDAGDGSTTDPDELLKAAKEVTYDEEDAPKAWGGPVDIYARSNLTRKIIPDDHEDEAPIAPVAASGATDSDALTPGDDEEASRTDEEE